MRHLHPPHEPAPEVSVEADSAAAAINGSASSPGTPTPTETSKPPAVETAPPPAETAPPAVAQPRSHRSQEAAGILRDLGGWLCRPRVRLTLAGLALLVIAALVGTGSAWTAPLLVVGVAMVLIGWVGPRLHGRLVMDWGQSGAKFELRAEILPSEHRAKRPATATPAPIPPVLAPSAGQPAIPAGGQPGLTPVASRLLNLAADEDDVIEGEAHTIEIDVAELKALIAAAEAAEASPETVTANGSTPRSQTS